MPDLIGKFTGSGTSVTSWTRLNGNYLFSIVGTHNSGTIQLEVRIPGTAPTEASAAIAFDSETTLTADAVKEASLGRGLEYRIAAGTASATTRVVFYALVPTNIG